MYREAPILIQGGTETYDGKSLTTRLSWNDQIRTAVQYEGDRGASQPRLATEGEQALARGRVFYLAQRADELEVSSVALAPLF